LLIGVVGASTLGMISMGLAVTSAVLLFAATAIRHAAIFGVAAVLASSAAVCNDYAQQEMKTALTEDIVQEMCSMCSRIPDEVCEAFRSAVPREFETNKLQIETYWEAANGDEHWHLKTQARRKWAWHAWTPSFLEVAYAETPSLTGAAIPPPQVRNWSSDSRPLSWRTLWKRGVLYAPGK